MGKLFLGFLILLAGAAALYAAAMAWLWWRQERLIFLPEKLAPDTVLARDADVSEVSVPVAGATLSALHLRLPSPRGLVFYLHGNAGSLASWFVAASHYRAAGYDLFMLDYRGYGKSTGGISSEAQLHEDVWTAWQQVAPRYTGRPVVVYGRSLGTALAATLSARLSQAGAAPALTVLVSPYTSMAALAAQHYPFVPGALLRYPLRTDEALRQVRGPVSLFHGALDPLIPPSHSETLAAQLRGAGVPVKLLLIEGAGHNDLQDFDSYLKAFFGALPGG